VFIFYARLPISNRYAPTISSSARSIATTRHSFCLSGQEGNATPFASTIVIRLHLSARFATRKHVLVKQSQAQITPEARFRRQPTLVYHDASTISMKILATAKISDNA